MTGTPKIDGAQYRQSRALCDRAPCRINLLWADSHGTQALSALPSGGLPGLGCPAGVPEGDGA
jgi:hypothetical protein